MLTDDSEILAANQAFYDAFTRADLATIEDLWASLTPIACIHPGWDALHGREDVLEASAPSSGAAAGRRSPASIRRRR